MSSYQDIASRVANAEDLLIETLRDAGAGSAAEEVAAYYIEIEAVKLDYTLGRYQVKHGALLDREVVLRAVVEVSSSKAA